MRFLQIKFWDTHKQIIFNGRQKQLIEKLFKNVIFNRIKTNKYATYFKISKETASRDLIDLYQKNVILKLPAGGRETAYYLAELGFPKENGAI